MNVVHKPELAKIFLACHVIEPQFQSPFRELRCELDENSYNRYQACLSRRDVEALMPADAAAARAFLLKVVDDATKRLRAIEAGLQKKSEASRARERNLIALGVSKTGEQIRRSQASFNRLLLRNIDAVRKVQREDDRGWEIVRKTREEKKALRRNQNKRSDCAGNPTSNRLIRMPRKWRRCSVGLRPGSSVRSPPSKPRRSGRSPRSKPRPSGLGQSCRTKP